MALAGEVIRAAGVTVDIVDVGGGFPVAYPEVEPPPLGAFIAEIEAGVRGASACRAARLWAEPGRALVAGGASVVVQVQQRRGDALHVNDGVYGSLADAGALGFRYPVRLVRPDGPAPADGAARVLVVRPDLRQRGCDARAVHAAGGHCRGRLDRDRPAWRVWRLPAHRRSMASIALGWSKCGTRRWGRRRSLSGWRRERSERQQSVSTLT